MSKFPCVAPENRNEILKFFFEVILENKSDENLYEVAVFNSNKHNDTTLTLLMKNYDVFRDTMGLYFQVFCEYFNKRKAHSEGFYRIVCQILQQNSCEANAKSLSDIIHQLTVVDPTFFREENYLFSYKNPKTKSNALMELVKNAQNTRDSKETENNVDLILVQMKERSCLQVVNVANVVIMKEARSF